MPIESMTIKLSGKSVGSRKSGNLLDQADVLKELATLCQKAGWAVVPLPATGKLSYPLGAPIRWGTPDLNPEPIDNPVWWFVYLGDLRYIVYDPNHNRPGSSDPFVRWVQAGLTPFATISNLAGMISADAQWIGRATVVDGIPVLSITAVIPGPELNYTRFDGEGRFGVGGGTGDGGFKMTSVEERNDLGHVVTAQYSVVATAGAFFNAATRHITHPLAFQIFQSSFTETEEFADKYHSDVLTLDTKIFDSFTDHIGHSFSTDTAKYPDGLGYSLVANPYSFAVWCPENPDVASIFVSAPYIPTEEGFVSENAVVVIYPRLGDSTFWTHSWVTMGSGPARTHGGNGYPRMMTVRSPGPNPLLTPSGAPLIIGAWIMFGANDTDTPGVVGKLWDCAMVHDDITGAGMLIGGKRYLRISHQSGPGVSCSSLLMCAPLNVDTTGFVNDPLVTTQVVTTFAVDVLLTGTSGGGVVVERQSGVQFNPGMVGLFLKFPNSGDVQYEILAFIDEDHIIAAITGWGGPTGQVFFPYIVDSVSQTTGGGAVHYRSTYGTGSISTSQTGQLTRLGWTSGNYLFDSWMLNKPIKIGGATYTVTRVSDDGRELAFWPPFSGGPSLGNIPYQVAG